MHRGTAPARRACPSPHQGPTAARAQWETFGFRPAAEPRLARSRHALPRSRPHRSGGDRRRRALPTHCDRFNAWTSFSPQHGFEVSASLSAAVLGLAVLPREWSRSLFLGRRLRAYARSGPRDRRFAERGLEGLTAWGSGQDSTTVRPGPSCSLARAVPLQAFGGLMTLALPTPTDDRRVGPDARRSAGRSPRP